MAQVTLKLFASLQTFLPDTAKDNQIIVDCQPEHTIGRLINDMRLPEERCHLVILNGIYIAPHQRPTQKLQDGDTLAIWPAVAGG